MAYVNVREWSPDQVTEWLRGLDNVILPYINSFLNNEVKGHQLLCLRSDDLEHLGVYTLGHQELILEAVEQLRNFHYELDRENLQLLALRLSCASRSLYNELLSAEDSSKIQTQTMSDVANIITTVKPLVCWLDRVPFSGQPDYLDRKTKLLQLSLEMATCAQRDIFAEAPIEKIRTACRSLAELADNIIRCVVDPMLLQPASLDLATLKKRENELGFSLMPTYHGVHQIAEIKFSSPAHASSKLEEGDEIVQVNYQTVVGWQRKKVLGLFQESPPDIVLTLKKRPRHTKVYGQIYMKPYRLPSKKRATPYSRWNDNLPSPRPELLTIPDFEMPLPRLPVVTQPQPLEPLESESSSDSEPPDSPLESQGRVYPLKPRPVLQRRNTITGASPTSKRPHQAIEQYWNELKHQAAYKHSSSTYIASDLKNLKRDSIYLRDKSASCGHGLELTQRPATYPKKFDKTLLINPAANSKSELKKRVNFEERKIIIEEHHNQETPTKTDPKIKTININSSDQGLEKSVSVQSLSSLVNCEESLKFIDDTVDEMYDRSHMSHMNVTEWKNEIIEELIVSLNKSCANLAEENVEKRMEALPRSQVNEVRKRAPEVPKKPEILKKPAVPPRNFTTKIRGRLDKSHSTPAYDMTQDTEQVQLEKCLKKPEILVTGPELAEATNRIFPEISPIIEAFNPILNSSQYSEIKDLSTRKFTESDSPPTPILSTKLADQPPEPPPRTVTTQLTQLNDVTSTTSSKVLVKQTQYETKIVSSTQVISLEATTKLCSDAKISPTNSVVRAMISKSKVGKKKNTLLAKRRKISVKDLNPCDLQGYLYQRLRNKQTQNFHWEKRWFVLLGNCLYGFKTKDASKAECLIFLTGFTVAVAHEIKSRLNAFQVYHTGTAFYFSAENSETMLQWVELIASATLHSDTKSSDNTLFTETDDSDCDKPKPDTHKPETTRKFGSLKKFTTKKSTDSLPESTSLDRKYLRIFNSTSSKIKNQLPVPTPQYRSYRKVIPPKPQQPPTIEKPPTPVETLKIKPINYIHASNPSLCDINDYRLQSFYQNKRQFAQRTENLSGFVTLEQFMLNRQEEERRQNLLYGRINDVKPTDSSTIQPDVIYGEVRTPYSKRKYSQPQLEPNTRSLPRENQQLFYVPTTSSNEVVQYAKKQQQSKLQRQHSLNAADTKQQLQQRSESFRRGESPEKFWLDSLRRSDKIGDKNTQKVRLKPVAQYTPMCLPLTPDQKGKLNPKFAFELNLDEKNSNKSGKLKNLFGRNPQDSEKREKTLLGSPRLHRALFRKQTQQQQQPETGADWQTEVPQVLSTNLTNVSHSSFSSNPNLNQTQSGPPPPDYPGLEYPPVFEPETYSLANPACSLTLLRKQQQQQQK